MAPRPHGAEVYIIRASGAEQEVTLNDGKFATAVFDGETVTIGLKMYNGTDGVFDAAKEDKPLSLDAMIHPLAICSLPPRHPQRPPDEIEVAWDALSNTYVCLFDGACRLALEATSPAERAVPCSRHTKWSKV